MAETDLFTLSDEELLRDPPLDLPENPNIEVLNTLCNQEFSRLLAVQKEYFARESGRGKIKNKDYLEGLADYHFTKLELWRIKVMHELIKRHESEPFLTAVDVLGWEIMRDMPEFIHAACLYAKGCHRDPIFRVVLSRALPEHIHYALTRFTGSAEGLDLLLEHLPENYDQEWQFMTIKRCSQLPGLYVLLDRLLYRNRESVENGVFKEWNVGNPCNEIGSSIFDEAVMNLYEDIADLLISKGLDDFNQWHEITFDCLARLMLDPSNESKSDFIIRMIDLLLIKRPLSLANITERIARFNGKASLRLILRLVEHLGLKFSDKQLIMLISHNINSQHVDTFDWAVSLIQRPGDLREGARPALLCEAHSCGDLRAFERIKTLFGIKNFNTKSY